MQDSKLKLITVIEMFRNLNHYMLNTIPDRTCDVVYRHYSNDLRKLIKHPLISKIAPSLVSEYSIPNTSEYHVAAIVRDTLHLLCKYVTYFPNPDEYLNIVARCACYRHMPTDDNIPTAELAAARKFLSEMCEYVDVRQDCSRHEVEALHAFYSEDEGFRNLIIDSIDSYFAVYPKQYLINNLTCVPRDCARLKNMHTEDNRELFYMLRNRWLISGNNLYAEACIPVIF